MHYSLTFTGQAGELVQYVQHKFCIAPLTSDGSFVLSPSDKLCHATEFSDTLMIHFPALKDCGGFLLLRSRGSTRSKALEVIPCPQEGYTPVYLSRQELGVGSAILYIRPLQRDIDLQVTV